MTAGRCNRKPALVLHFPHKIMNTEAVSPLTESKDEGKKQQKRSARKQEGSFAQTSWESFCLRCTQAVGVNRYVETHLNSPRR